MDTLKSFIDVFYFIEENSAPFSDPSFLSLLRKTRTKFLLYGEDDEIQLFERFIFCCENVDVKEANIALDNLISLVRKKNRKELDIP